MKLSKSSTYSILIFILFYLSLFIGFLIGEDTAGGAKYDYNFHLEVRDFFLSDTLNALKNFLNANAFHSPIFYIFLKYLLAFNETIGRFIFLNISILIPIIFYLSLKKIVDLDKSIILLISCFFFISPYFRSTAIWPGDENLAILFFLCSIYFYILYKNSNSEKDKNLFIIGNILFVAIASYFRPNYSLFSIFFFYELVLKKFSYKNFFIYIIVSALLAYPAIHYVFILKINFFYGSLQRFNLFNSFPLAYSVFIFFLVPFILFEFKNLVKNHKINYLNLLLTILLTFIVYFFFNYDLSHGGGIIFMFQKYFFTGNIFMCLVFAISFYISNVILNIKKTSNFLLLIILILFELDSYFYMETYDPLFLICLFLLFDTAIIKNFFKNKILFKINILFCYLFIFYIAKIINIYVLLNKL